MPFTSSEFFHHVFERPQLEPEAHAYLGLQNIVVLGIGPAVRNFPPAPLHDIHVHKTSLGCEVLRLPLLVIARLSLVELHVLKLKRGIDADTWECNARQGDAADLCTSNLQLIVAHFFRPTILKSHLPQMAGLQTCRETVCSNLWGPSKGLGLGAARHPINILILRHGSTELRAHGKVVRQNLDARCRVTDARVRLLGPASERAHVVAHHAIDAAFHIRLQAIAQLNVAAAVHGQGRGARAEHAEAAKVRTAVRVQPQSHPLLQNSPLHQQRNYIAQQLHCQTAALLDHAREDANVRAVSAEARAAIPQKTVHCWIPNRPPAKNMGPVSWQAMGKVKTSLKSCHPNTKPASGSAMSALSTALMWSLTVKCM
mmetsp:Transcript_92221/g.269875  ORF Transcript_92221/g.269875 Transcript_92221/m.269875 type:complete len:371 (-) Transcript_92221:1207-2319(-)